MKRRITFSKSKLYLGSAIPTILIIATAFIIIIYGLLFMLSIQLDFSHRQIASEKALNIAEAGINYYRWHLAHDPDDFQDGTNQTGPYVHDYYDPQGGIIGKYSLTITPPSNGSSIVTIRSTGWTVEKPTVRRTIVAQYGTPSFAEFSFLSNASMWFGSGITVSGQIHSNQGIRMDGTNTSEVTSALSTYTCGSETGCSPPQTRPGVWTIGPGGDQGLWEFPVPSVDFDSISFDFSGMRDSAQQDGLYIGPSTYRGYHFIFNSNGTFNVYRVNNTNYIDGYAVTDGCQRRYQTITNETFVGTYSIANEPIIFVEGDVWVEGTIKGRTTLAAVKFPIQTSSANIWIRNNVVYTDYNGSDSLGLIAQNDIYFVKNVPNFFQVDAVMMAQKGTILRHGYWNGCGGSSNAVRQQLTINGSVISYYKSYWNFGSGSTLTSGFVTRQINYDSDVLFNPPPYFPTSGEYEFISWTEE